MEEEKDAYQITCRLCKGTGKVKDMPGGQNQKPDPRILEIIRAGGDPRIDKVCPACGGTGKLTAYKSLDELAKTIHKRSRSNLIVSMVDTVLIGTGKTACGVCGKEREVICTARISTVAQAGQFSEEQIVTLQLCKKCMEKYGVTQDKVCHGQQEGPKILLADGQDVKSVVEDNKRLKEGPIDDQDVQR